MGHDSEPLEAAQFGEASPEEKAFRYRTLVWSSTYMLLQSTGFAMFVTPMTRLFLLRSCYVMGLDEASCSQDNSAHYHQAEQGMTSNMAVVLFLVGAAQMSTISFYGGLGDAYGRWIPILLPNIGMVLMGVCNGLLPESMLLASFVLSFVAGFFGNGECMKQGVRAMLADATMGASEDVRSMYFGIMESMFYGGFLLGPGIGSVTSDAYGPKAAIALSALCGATNIVLLAVTYTETLEPSRRRPFEWARANPFGSIRMFNRSAFTRKLALVLVLNAMGASCLQALIIPYSLRISNGSQDAINLNMAAMSVATLFMLVFALPILTRIFWWPIKTVCFALGMGVVVAVMCSATTTMGQMLLISVPTGVMPISMVMLSWMSSMVFGDKHFGESQAGVQFLWVATSAWVAPLAEFLYSRTVDLTIGLGPGLTVHCVTFLFAAAALALAFGAALWMGDVPEDEVPKLGDPTASVGVCSVGDLTASHEIAGPIIRMKSLS